MDQQARSIAAQTRAVDERIWTRDFILICLSNMFFFMGFQMLIPTLPLYVSQLSGNNTLVGLVVGIFTFSALLVRPWAGYAVESWGRKLVLLLGISLVALTVGSFALIGSVLFLFMMRILQGAGFGMSTTAAGTIATDLIPPRRRGEGMGYYGLSGNLAMVVGPAIGLTLAQLVSFPVLFGTSAALAVLAFAMGATIHTRKAAHPPQEASLKGRFQLIEPTALPPSFLILFISTAFGAISTYLALYAETKGIQGVQWYFVVFAISLLCTRMFSGRWYDRWGHRAVVVPGCLLIVTALLLLFFLEHFLMMLAAGFCFGTGFGIIQPGLQAWSVDSAPLHRKGMANATYFSFFDLGIGISAIFFGWISQWVGYQGIYLLAAGTVSVAILLYLLFMRNIQPQKV